MKPILIIGGGISGITSAVELAEAGKDVILVEKEAHLGGNVAKMHNYFPKLCPPACGLEINFRRIRQNARITVLTSSEVTDISGEKGNFRVKVNTRAPWVNDRCTACGECSAICPVERPDNFNFGVGTTKAIWMPNQLAFPQKYTIDPGNCKGLSCNKCAAVCRYEAIDLNRDDEEMALDVHSILITSGWKNFPAEKITGLGYGTHPDIVTNVEFERLLSTNGPGEGLLKRRSDGTPPKNIAFVQCAGSRDRNFLPYCSAVCCSASLKHALNAVELLPEAQVSIYYIDLRVTGRNEDFLERVRSEKHIKLVKGKVAAVQPGEGGSGLSVTAEDMEAGRKITMKYDLVVLATGIMPADGIPELLKNPEGFFVPIPMEGIRVAGCAARPMDVSASVKEATAAALHAMKI